MNVFLNNSDTAVQFANLTRSEDIARAEHRRVMKEARRSQPIDDDSAAATKSRTRLVFAVLRAVRYISILRPQRHLP